MVEVVLMVIEPKDQQIRTYWKIFNNILFFMNLPNVNFDLLKISEKYGRGM